VIKIRKILTIILVLALVTGCAPAETEESGEPEQKGKITLSYGEGYNFKENKKYGGEFMDMFMKVDIMYGEIGGGEKNMIETRSSLYDNGAVNIEDAKPVPEDSYNTFYAPEIGHVYSFRLWSANETFEGAPGIAIKITEVTEKSVSFEYLIFG